MSSPQIPNDMQNQQQQQNVQGGFRCPRCLSYNNLCHRCLSYSSIYNLRYYCNNCRRPPWTRPIGRQAHNSTTGNNRSMNRSNRRLTFSAVSVSSSSTAAPPATSSSSSVAAAADNAGPSSSMSTAVEPTLSNWLPQPPSMLRPVVQISRPPALTQQQIPNTVQIFPRPPTLTQQQLPNIVQIFPRPPILPQQQNPNIFQISPRPPALPQQQNPNMGIIVTKKPVVCLDLSLRPPESLSGTIPQQRRPLPFDLNMAPPDS